MRWLKLSLASALAAFIAAWSVGTAEAGWRWKLRYADPYPEYETYYPGPIYIPPPRYKRQYERYSSYDDDGYDDDFDPDYYEPEYVPPKKKMKKPQKSQKPVTKPKSAKKPTTQPQAKKTGAITCDKASKIVSGYGFSAVKPSTCEGKEYAFAATRDGKNYVIKMSSANGELTQVQKQ
jgi:hypothetical protein